MAPVNPDHTPIFFALTESRDLGGAVCKSMDLLMAVLEEQRFEGGEFKLRLPECVTDRSALILQCLAGTPQAPVAERLLRLLFLLHGLRDAGAARRIALLPYLTFARQERRTQVGDPINTRYFAQLLESAGADAVITLDVHDPAALDNSFRIPVVHLTALPLLVDHFATRLPGERLAVVSPDIGGIKRAQIFRELLAARLGREVELAFFEKRRSKGVISGHTLVGETKDRVIIVIDDLCVTGHTLMRAAEACNRAGAAAVYAAFTHAPLPSGLAAVLADAHLKAVVTTDSVGFDPDGHSGSEAGKLTVLPIAPLLAQATQRVLACRPLAPLLERWPVDPTE
jgi:ribose-phosphate pyrophosphokinase